MRDVEKIEANGAVAAQLMLGNQMLRILLDLDSDDSKEGSVFTTDLNESVYTVTIEKGDWTN